MKKKHRYNKEQREAFRTWLYREFNLFKKKNEIDSLYMHVRIKHHVFFVDFTDQPTRLSKLIGCWELTPLEIRRRKRVYRRFFMLALQDYLDFKLGLPLWVDTH